MTGADLPIGLQSEPTLLMTILKFAAGAFGSFLLLAGKRFPRLAVGSFYLVLGLIVGGLFAPTYPAAVLIALGVFSVAMLVDAFAHRLSAAIASVWLAPVATLGYLAYTGSLDANIPLVLILTGTGFIIAVFWPRLAAAAISVGLGTIFLARALGVAPEFPEIMDDFPLVMAVALACWAWQAFFLPVPERVP
jgi:hypothetical protein